MVATTKIEKSAPQQNYRHYTPYPAKQNARKLPAGCLFPNCNCEFS